MRDRLWNKCFVICLALQTLYMLSFNMVTPLVANYVVELGGSVSVAGVVAGMFSFCAFAFRPFVGYAADMLERKRFMVVGLALCIIAMVGYGLADDVLLVAVWRVVHACALCVQTTLIAVIAVDHIPHSRVAEGVGYIGIAAMVGMSVGPGVGVLIADCMNTQAAFFSGAFVMLAGMGLAAVLPESRFERDTASNRFSFAELFDLEALPLSLSAMSFAFCAGLTSSFIVLFGMARKIEGVAAFFFLSSLLMVFVRPVAGRFTDRCGLNAIVPVSFVSELAAMLCLAFAHALPAVLASATLRAFGQGMAQSSIQGQVLKDASEERRGVASSTFYLGIDLGQGLGAVVGGVIAGWFGYSGAFISGPCMLVVGLIPYVVWKRARHMRAGRSISVKERT